MLIQRAWMQKAYAWASAISPGRVGRACLYFSGGGVASAALEVEDDRLKVRLRADPVTSLAEAGQMLAEQDRTLKLGRACNLVLAPELYSTQLIERPNVADDELIEAVRWKLKDQIDFPVEHAALDVFPLPESAGRHQDMVFAVCLPQDMLRGLVEAVDKVGLGITSIDISELALRNLSWHCFPMADQSVALLRLTSNSGLINVCRSEDLFLSRRLSGVPTDLSDAAWLEFRDQLLLQVQRSLDYYQSAMGQPECNMLMVACTDGWTQKVCDYLAEMLPMPVRSVREVLASEVDLTLYNPEQARVDWQNLSEQQGNALAAALPALGGALRFHIDQAHLEHVA